MTQVFEPGLRDGGSALGHTSTGLIPAFQDEFARGATSRIDFGPHEAFGPPPDEVTRPEPDAAGVFDRFRRIRSHAPLRRKKRRGGLAVVLVLVAFAAAAALRFVPASPWYPDAAGDDEPVAPAAFPFHAPAADVLASSGGAGGFVSWAYQDLRDGSVVGSVNQAETTPAASILTSWLAADLLSRSAETGERPAEADLADITSMLQFDDPAATLKVLERVGGAVESVTRLISSCGLQDMQPPVLPPGSTPGAWLETPISARDAARMGGCVASGRAAGAEWTNWLLTVMRQVRGEGDFGVRDGLADGERVTVAIKNGVLPAGANGEWQVNCVGLGATWALAVLQRYPATGDDAADLAHLRANCAEVVRELSSS